MITVISASHSFEGLSPLVRLTVRLGSHERSFADTNTDTLLNQINPIRGTKWGVQ